MKKGERETTSKAIIYLTINIIIVIIIDIIGIEQRGSKYGNSYLQIIVSSQCHNNVNALSKGKVKFQGLLPKKESTTTKVDLTNRHSTNVLERPTISLAVYILLLFRAFISY